MKTRSFDTKIFLKDLKDYGGEFEGKPDDQGLSVSGEIKQKDKVLSVKFQLEGRILYPCARCLVPIPMKCVYEFSEDIEQEEELDTIDLIPFVEECLFVNEPFKVLCEEECMGLCPGCGVNLNHQECQCDTNGDIDPRMEALKQLLK